VLGIAGLAMLTMSTGGYGYRWFAGSFKTEYQAMAKDDKAPYKYSYVCQKSLLNADSVHNNNCDVGPPFAAPPRALLWGDSNAAHYVGALSVIAERGKFRFFNLEHSACPPLLTDPKPFVTEKTLKNCRESLRNVRTRLRDFDVLILSSSWSEYESRSSTFFGVFEATVVDLLAQGKHVILVGKAPGFSSYDRLCGKKALLFPFLECGIEPSSISQNTKEANAYLKEMAATHSNVDYYDFEAGLCNAGLCSPYDAHNYPLYFDKSHLSIEGSRRVGTAILESAGVPTPFRILVRE